MAPPPRSSSRHRWLWQVRTEDPDQLEALSQFNGMAFASKLIVYDYLACPADYDLYLPEDIYSDYFGDAHRHGARIASNSWGDDSGAYDSYARDTDRFQYDHPDFLVVFAAGNTGEEGSFTLATPGVAKNGLTVGSSHNHPLGCMEQGKGSGIAFAMPGGPVRVLAPPADFGPAFVELALQNDVDVVWSEPRLACDTITNVDVVRGAIVLVERCVSVFFVPPKTSMGCFYYCP